MYIAIDVGGTKINVSSFEELNPHALTNKFELKTSDKFSKNISQIIDKLKSLKTKPRAISIALPGFIVDEEVGIVSAANLPTWEGQDVKKALASITHPEKVFLLHDAKAHGMAELIFAKTSNPFLNIAWGTGIGGTYIKRIGDQIHSQQIEFGYQTVKGVYIEKLVGGVNFEKRFHKKASEMSESEWVEVVDDMATGMGNLFALNYAPQVIWGGGVAIKQKHRIKEVMEKAHQRYPFWPMPEYRFSTFNENGGVIGALANIKFQLNN